MEQIQGFIDKIEKAWLCNTEGGEHSALVMGKEIVVWLFEYEYGVICQRGIHGLHDRFSFFILLLTETFQAYHITSG